MLSNDDTIFITATPEARAMLRRLVLTHGPAPMFRSGGCCDGSVALCLLADDLAPGPGDVLLGEVDGVTSRSSSSQMGEPEFELDVVSGAPGGLLARP